MKNFSQILNLLLASVLVLLAVKITSGANQPKIVETQKQSLNNGMDVIMTRSSVRSFTDRRLEPEKIEQLLRAAMAAPTAGNKQPWVFIVVDDKELLQALSDALPYSKMVSKAPLAIIVCGDLSKGYEGIESQYWIQDVSAASENILLAAHSLELGAVWTGVFPVEERIKAVSKLLNLPENVIPLNVIPVGYPAKESVPKDKWKKKNVHYNGY